MISLGVALIVGGGAAAAWALNDSAEERPVEGASVPDSFAGTWSGRMVQEEADGDHVIDWDTRIKLEGGVERGSSEWYTLDCRGSLTLAERDGDRLVFDYVETYDPEDHCVDEAELTLRPGGSEGEIAAKWNATSEGDTPMISTGTLR
ncbi:hypothetical protein F4561_000689 [Lipingzhangella halophila]|uniref:Lipocalin-like domain-containing protein n=1 Tax=Lipingzhangella halophila TaxID=1783352 RepID=A0A7W7RDA1_9ACTN|nr:hypothetical protein [Lipingzhangella halophila]MBB4929869.1 hypothetical protein [Lipingzhangella halophila]